MVRLTPADKNAVPKEPGVYMVCAAPPGYRMTRRRTANVFKLLYSPLYVGKSGDLNERFTAHCATPKPEIVESQKCFRGNLDFWFLRLKQGSINDMEAALIQCFGPPVNRVSGISARLGKGVPA
jgi:hypothetical protein